MEIIKNNAETNEIENKKEYLQNLRFLEKINMIYEHSDCSQEQKEESITKTSSTCSHQY
jgi:nitrate reductase NapAB chaperone NapD